MTCLRSSTLIPESLCRGLALAKLKRRSAGGREPQWRSIWRTEAKRRRTSALGIDDNLKPSARPLRAPRASHAALHNFLHRTGILDHSPTAGSELDRKGGRHCGGATASRAPALKMPVQDAGRGEDRD